MSCCDEQRAGNKAHLSPGVPGQPVVPGNKILLVEQKKKEILKKLPQTKSKAIPDKKYANARKNKG